MLSHMRYTCLPCWFNLRISKLPVAELLPTEPVVSGIALVIVVDVELAGELVRLGEASASLPVADGPSEETVEAPFRRPVGVADGDMASSCLRRG